MPLKGSLRDFSLPDLFQLIHFGKKNGTLVIARGDSMGYVCFRNGNVFFATNNWKKPPLGERLVEAGVVTRQQVDEALELQATSRPDRRVGNILVELGYLKRESLEVFVEENIRDAVLSLLRWNEGEFDFDPDQIFPEEDIGLSMSTEDLIMEGSRRLEEWSKLEQKVPSLDAVFVLSGETDQDFSSLNLNSEERVVLDQVDGRTTVRDMIEKTGQSALITCRALYGLAAAKVICLPNSGAKTDGGEAAGSGEILPAGGPGPDSESVVPRAETGPGEAQDCEPAASTGPERETAPEPESEDVIISIEGDGEYEEVIVEQVEPSRRHRKKSHGKKPGHRGGAPAGEGGAPFNAGAGGRSEALDEEVEAATGDSARTEAVEEPLDAPAPGQSLVDYYKSIALRELGDSEIFRETEEKAMTESVASPDPVDYSEEGFTGTIEAASKAEMQLPEDIPMEWSGHLTRLRGRGGRPAEEKPPAETAEGETEQDALAGREPGSEVEEVAAAAGGQWDGAPGGPTVLPAIEHEMDSLAVELETEPLAAEPVTESPLSEEPFVEDIFAAEPVPESPPAAEPLERSAEVPPAEAPRAEDRPPESFVMPEVDFEQDRESTLDALPSETDERVLEEEPGGPPADDDRAGEVPEPPPLQGELISSEEEIEKLMRVSSQSRGELSREELLAFDQPTYPIVESRELSPLEEAEEPVLEGRIASSPTSGGDDRGGMGQVLRFGKAGVRQEVEVILEQPEPLVHPAFEESISVAEDLEVPVYDGGVREVAGLGVAVAHKAPDAEPGVPLVLPEMESLVPDPGIEPVRQEDEAGEIEIIGLDEGAVVIPLDASRMSVAEELDIDAPPPVEEDPPEPSVATAEVDGAGVSGEAVAGPVEDGPLAAPTAEPEEAGFDAKPSGAFGSLAAGEESTAEAVGTVSHGPDGGEVAPGFIADEAAPRGEAVEAAVEPGGAEPPVGEQASPDAEAYEHALEEEAPAVSGGVRVAPPETVDEPAAIDPGYGTVETGARGGGEAAEEATTGSSRAGAEPRGSDLEPEGAPGIAEDGAETMEMPFLGFADELAAMEAEAVVEAGALAEPGEDLAAVAEPEVAGEAGEEDLDVFDDVDDMPGLFEGIQVSGKREAGTSLIDLETFELEQELLELAGGFQKKKQRMPVAEKQPADQDKKKKRGAGRPRGKEVDKGSVKKIIDDLKGK